MSTANRKKWLAVFAAPLNWARPLAIAAVATFLLGECNGSDSVTAPATPASIVISAPSGTTPAGGTLQFTATVKDSKGNTIVHAVTWSVAHGGGTINSSGLFTAADSAATYANTVVAAIGAVASAGSSVTVTAGALSTIAVTPATVSLAASATQQFTAVGKDAHGNVVPLPGRAWSVTAAGGTIDTSGIFTAGTTAGTFTNTVLATSGADSGSASVTVGGGPLASIEITLDTTTVANGGTHQYIVTGKDAHGNVVPVVPAPTWSVVAGGGTIDPTTGLFTAGTVSGTFVNTIQVVSGTMSANLTVTVAPGPLATITVSPAAPSFAINATQQFTAVGKDAHDNVVVITPVWSVVAGGGTIDASTGLFTAGATGAGRSRTRFRRRAVRFPERLPLPYGRRPGLDHGDAEYHVAIGGRYAGLHRGWSRCGQQRSRDHASMVGGCWRRYDRSRHRPVHGWNGRGNVYEHGHGNERRDFGHRDGDRYAGCAREPHDLTGEQVAGRKRDAAVHGGRYGREQQRRRPSFRPRGALVAGGGTIDARRGSSPQAP